MMASPLPPPPLDARVERAPCSHLLLARLPAPALLRLRLGLLLPLLRRGHLAERHPRRRPGTALGLLPPLLGERHPLERDLLPVFLERRVVHLHEPPAREPAEQVLEGPPVDGAVRERLPVQPPGRLPVLAR